MSLLPSSWNPVAGKMMI